jgi:asparagine synthase (glutamine-hydrolysing)
MEHVPISTTGRSPLASLDRNFYLFERPVLNLANSVWTSAILDEAKARRLPVLLTGSMGNLSFSHGGMELLSELLGRGRLLRLAREIGALRREGTRYGTIAAQLFGRFTPAPVWQGIARLRGRSRELGDYSAVSPKALARFRIAERAAGLGLDLSFRPRAGGATARREALGRIDRGNYTKGTLAGWGVDLRDPSGDRRLVEFCLRVPAGQFLHAGVPRALARDAFADRLPAEVVSERRKGYQAADWHVGLDGARAALAEDLGRISADPAAAAALDVRRLRRLA